MGGHIPNLRAQTRLLHHPRPLIFGNTPHCGALPDTKPYRNFLVLSFVGGLGGGEGMVCFFGTLGTMTLLCRPSCVIIIFEKNT
jgi:hypothetical protein